MSTLRVNNMTNVGGDGPTYAKGSVIQTLQAIKSDTSSFGTLQTWTDVSGLSIAITPKSTSSKILISASVNVGSATLANVYLRTLRSDNVIGVGATSGQLQASSMARIMDDYTMPILSWQILDTPSSTSLLTYKIQIASNVTNTCYVNRSNNDTSGWNNARPISTITVQEIAG